MPALDWPRVNRLAIENGRATPTKNENDGWIRSWSEQSLQVDVHSACSWWKHKNSHSAPPILVFTAQSRSTSAIIKNITSPR